MMLTWDWREIRKSLKKRDKSIYDWTKKPKPIHFAFSSSITNEPSPSLSVPHLFHFITILIIIKLDPHILFSWKFLLFSFLKEPCSSRLKLLFSWWVLTRFGIRSTMCSLYFFFGLAFVMCQYFESTCCYSHGLSMMIVSEISLETSILLLIIIIFSFLGFIFQTFLC